MNFIALTGRDMHAMAQAAEILLDLVTVEQLQVAIALHVNSFAMATAIKDRAGPLGIGQLWRIGNDDTHPRLDRLVDVQISDTEMLTDPAGFLYARLLAFRDRIRQREGSIPQLSLETTE